MLIEMAEVLENITNKEARFLNGDDVGEICAGSLFPISEIQYSENKILVDTGAGPLILPRNKIKIIKILD